MTFSETEHLSKLHPQEIKSIYPAFHKGMMYALAAIPLIVMVTVFAVSFLIGITDSLKGANGFVSGENSTLLFSFIIGTVSALFASAIVIMIFMTRPMRRAKAEIRTLAEHKRIPYKGLLKDFQKNYPKIKKLIAAQKL